jgi:hypothetical protein
MAVAHPVRAELGRAVDRGSARILELEEELSEERGFDTRMREELMQAANAIREGDQWPVNAWPSPVERCWYVAAQRRIAELERARAPLPREPSADK